MSTRPFDQTRSGRINARPRNVGFDQNGQRVVGLTSAQRSAGMRADSLQRGLNGLSSLPQRQFGPTRSDLVRESMRDGSFAGIRQKFNEDARGTDTVMNGAGDIIHMPRFGPPQGSTGSAAGTGAGTGTGTGANIGTGAGTGANTGAGANTSTSASTGTGTSTGTGAGGSLFAQSRAGRAVSGGGARPAGDSALRAETEALKKRQQQGLFATNAATQKYGKAKPGLPGIGLA